MRMLIFILFGMLMVTFQNAEAQDNQPPNEIDCNTIIETDLEIDLEPFVYVYACDWGYDCYTEEDVFCHFQLATEMSKACEIDDISCRNQELLNSVELYLRGNTRFGSFPPPSPLLLDTFLQVINAVITRDFETALALLQDPMLANYYLYPLMLYSRGLIYEMLGDPAMALHEYDEALKIVPNHTLFHYSRGLLLGKLGNVTEASFESAWLEDYFQAFVPELLPRVAPLTEAYPLDSSRLTAWIKYPIMLDGSSPMGTWYRDLTSEPSVPVQIGVYDEVERLLAIDVVSMRYPRYSGDVLNTYVFHKIDEDDYRYEFLDLSGTSQGRITLTFSDDLIWGEEVSYGAESGATTSFILAPPDYPDPRQVYGEPACEGGVISRLHPGMYVSERGYGSGFAYVETPGEELDWSLYFEGVEENDYIYWPKVRVTDQFTCIGSDLWWEVTDDLGNTGWRAENSGNQYEINPMNDLREFFYCPVAPALRLYVRAEGRVIEGLGANNLRAEAETDSELLTTIPEGEEFTVSAGPICADGMAWWQVEYGDVTGWTAEGDNQNYWIEPVPPVFWQDINRENE